MSVLNQLLVSLTHLDLERTKKPPQSPCNDVLQNDGQVVKFITLPKANIAPENRAFAPKGNQE